ncbi:hypothetical protein [Nocardiopsis potens]|uniref:hypothetical protein n=1 Tax=Nocardiopsis potens TaxID=1246458 RepID=UPI00034D9449|nr:hypothetical protein [Nocardiopsis potens]
MPDDAAVSAVNSVVNSTGPVSQVGVVEGDLHNGDVYNIFRLDGGAEVAHAPRRDSSLAVPRPGLEGPDMRSRYELLWNRKVADPDRVHLLNLHGRKGGWSGEFARRLCHAFQEELPEVDPVVRAIDLDRFPGRMGAQELLRDLGIPESYTVNDPGAVLEKAVQGLDPMALLLENGDRIGAVEPLLSAPAGSLVVITSERPLHWLGGLRREWSVAEPLPAGPLSVQDARGVLWRRLAALRPLRTPSDDEIERLFAEESAREADAIGYTAAAIAFGKGNRSMAGTPDAAYALLPEEDRVLVRYLGHCPEGMGLQAAALAAGHRGKDVRESLEDLVRYGLAERDDTGRASEPRYRLTAAAAERASGRWAAAAEGEDPADLAKAVCEVYHSLALDAHLAVMPQRPLVSEERTEPQRPMGEEEARTWLRSERHALGEAVKLAVGLGEARLAGRICQALWALYFTESLYLPLCETHRRALPALAKDIRPDLLLRSRIHVQAVRGRLETAGREEAGVSAAEEHGEAAIADADGAPEERGPRARLVLIVRASAREHRAEAHLARAELLDRAEDGAGAGKERARALTLQRQAVALSEEAGDLRSVVVQRQKLARCLRAGGDAAGERKELEQAWDEVRRLPAKDAYNEGRIQMELARGALEAGAGADRIGEHIEAALERFRGAHRRRTADVLCLRADLREAQGDATGAGADLREAAELYRAEDRVADLHRVNRRLRR